MHISLSSLGKKKDKKKKTRKRVQTEEYEFKHLFKQKFQTTPPFNLSKTMTN